MGQQKKTVRDKVIEVLESARGDPLKPKRIAEISGANYNSVRRVLYQLLSEGVVHRYMGGYILSKYMIDGE
ncbi:MAG: DNA-binding protein [Desulfurococcales archaeon]|nr:DNA-binding protein [Desulfurococcales archaeon]